MDQESAIAIDKVVGTRKVEGQHITLLALGSSNKILKLALPNKLLSSLALTVLKAITNNEGKKGEGNPWLPDWVEAYKCERWEVHVSNERKAVLLCFRVVGNVWIRLELPVAMAKSVQEALSVLDNAAVTTPPNVTRN